VVSGEHPEGATPRATLTGTVTYVQRNALTPEAVVQVELRDVSDPQAEPALVAKQVIRKPGQVPIAFSLEYDPAAILPSHRYSVSARISDRGQLQFVTDTEVPVLGSGASAAAEIGVVPVK
jgi:putative lipoprotein